MRHTLDSSPASSGCSWSFCGAIATPAPRFGYPLGWLGSIRPSLDPVEGGMHARAGVGVSIWRSKRSIGRPAPGQSMCLDGGSAASLPVIPAGGFGASMQPERRRAGADSVSRQHGERADDAECSSGAFQRTTKKKDMILLMSSIEGQGPRMFFFVFSRPIDRSTSFLLYFGLKFDHQNLQAIFSRSIGSPFTFTTHPPRLRPPPPPHASLPHPAPSTPAPLP